MNKPNFLDSFEDKLTQNLMRPIGALKKNHRFKDSILDFLSDTAWISIKLWVGLHICVTLHISNHFQLIHS